MTNGIVYEVNIECKAALYSSIHSAYILFLLGNPYQRIRGTYARIARATLCEDGVKRRGRRSWNVETKAFISFLFIKIYYEIVLYGRLILIVVVPGTMMRSAAGFSWFPPVVRSLHFACTIICDLFARAREPPVMWPHSLCKFEYWDPPTHSTGVRHRNSIRYDNLRKHQHQTVNDFENENNRYRAEIRLFFCKRYR